MKKVDNREATALKNNKYTYCILPKSLLDITKIYELIIIESKLST